MTEIIDVSFMLQNTLIGYYKTNHIIFDIILTFVIVAVCQKLRSMSLNLNIFQFLKFEKKIMSEYVIECSIMSGDIFGQSKAILIPFEFKALMYKIDNTKAKIKSVKQLDLRTNSSGRHYSYVINDKEHVRLTDNVWIKQINLIEKSNDNKVERESYNLYVFSYTLTFNELKDQIEKWVNEYDKYTKISSNTNELYYYSYFGIDINNKKHLLFDKSLFGSNKNFGNIFFEQKDELIERLNYFINNEKDYERLGTPHMFGLLLNGEPGCGKTSTIKAIANYTKRHIISVPLSRVTTCRELTKLFMDEFVSEKYIPIKSRIYVFEDIDCMCNIIIDRDQIVTENQDKNNNKILVSVNESKSNDDKAAEKDKLTLSFILNLIDGILEQPGRMIIITTNKPEKLDKALLRSGRMDMKLHFGKCSDKVTKEILQFVFEEEIKKDHIDLNKYNFQNDKFTPAEIFEFCYNLKNFNKVCKFIS